LLDKHRTTISKQVKTSVTEIGKNASVCAKFARTGADEKTILLIAIIVLLLMLLE